MELHAPTPNNQIAGEEAGLQKQHLGTTDASALLTPHAVTIGGSKPSASGTLLFLCQCDVVEPLSSQWDHHSLQCPSTQYSFVEAACTTAGCQTGGVANVTTLDSAPVGQAPPSSSIPHSLPCPSNGMLPSNPTMSSLPNLAPSSPQPEVPVRDVGTSFDSRGLAKFSGHMFLCGFINQATVQFHAYNPSGILFYQINSVITDFLGVKMHGGLPWLIFDVGSGPAVVGSNSTRTFIDGQWHTGHVVLFEQASNTFYVTVDTVHAAAITDVIVPLLTMKVYFEGFPSTRADMALQPLTACVLSPPEWYLAPDGFDAVSVQNVGSTYIIVSWDLPTHSNGILINFSLYCNGALAGVLPLTVISYNTTGLLPFTFYMYMSSSHAHRHCTPVGTWCWASSVLQPACPGTVVYVGLGLPQNPQGQSKVYTTIVLAKMNTHLVVAPGHKEHEEPLAMSIPNHWMENYSSLGSKFRSRLGGVTSSQDAA
eukprot:Em0021g523a